MLATDAEDTAFVAAASAAAAELEIAALAALYPAAVELAVETAASAFVSALVAFTRAELAAVDTLVSAVAVLSAA